MSYRKCANCRKKAVWRIKNSFTASANGKVVCESNVCFGTQTGGYPAEATRFTN